MKISFCCQTMNRLWQLRQTLPMNVSVLAGTRHELIILDCGSSDGTDEYVRGYSGIRYSRRPMHAYHIPRAKNAAHSLATGDYVFNLDADNFITSRLIDVIERNPSAIVHDLSGVYGDGSYGRIGAPTALWKAIGGYDERLMGAGTHDWLFLSRAAKLGATIITPRTVSAAPPLLNPKTETIRNLGNDLTFEEILSLNRDIVARLPVFLPSSRIDLLPRLVGPGSGTARRIPILPPCDPAVLRYWFRFSSGCDFAAGGKLPGLGGGSCPTGGSPAAGGWSARPMWRGAQLELYVYRGSRQDSRFGESFPFGTTLQPGEWYEIRIKYSGGRVTAELLGRTVDCAVDAAACSAVLYHVFRGGSTPEFASDRPAAVWISNTDPGEMWQDLPAVTRVFPAQRPSGRPEVGEPFKTPPPDPLLQSGEKKRPWPTPQEMLRHNRGPDVGCCSRPTNREIKTSR